MFNDQGRNSPVIVFDYSHALKLCSIVLIDMQQSCYST